MGYKKNTGSQWVTLAAVKNSDGTALTGLTLTVKRSIDGGSQASGGGTVTELALGQYSYAYDAADLNGLDCSLYFTGTNMIPVNYTVVTDTKLVSELNDHTAAQAATAVLTSTVTGTVYATGEVGYLLSNYLNSSIAALQTSVNALPTALQIATQVWITTLTGTVYATGEAGYLLSNYLNASISALSAAVAALPTAAQNATAVWTTTLTGTVYATGEAGYLLSNYLNASIATLTTNVGTLQTSVNALPTAAQIATAVWITTLTGTVYATGEAGYLLATYLDAAVSSVSGGSAPTTTEIAAAVWTSWIAGTVYAVGEAGYILSNVAVGSPPSAAAIAQAVWQDTTAGDFTVVGSPGAYLMALPTALQTANQVWITTLTGTVYATGEAGYLLSNYLNASLATLTTSVGTLQTSVSALPTGVQIATAVWTTTLTGTVYATGEAGYLLPQITDKTGYKLAADGLDVITNTDPLAERPANFRETLAWLFRRFGNKVVIDRSAGTITTYKDDGTTVLSAQPYTQSSLTQAVDPLT